MTFDPTMGILNPAIPLGLRNSLHVPGTLLIIPYFVTTPKTLLSEGEFRFDQGGVSQGGQRMPQWVSMKRWRWKPKEAVMLSCHFCLSWDGSVRALGSRTGWTCRHHEGHGWSRLPANPHHEHPLSRARTKTFWSLFHVTFYNLKRKRREGNFIVLICIHLITLRFRIFFV